MTPDLKDLISDLQLLLQYEKIDRSNYQTILSSLKTDTFRNYLSIICNTKPETAFETVLRDFLQALGIRNIPQAKIQTDWIDYEISGGPGTNPVGLEVKPLHKCIKDTGIIRLNELSKELQLQKRAFERKRSNQITHYLEKYDYVIFTNGKDVYYFSREARFNFEPFHKESFIQFIKDFETVKDAWELARRKEDAIPKVNLDEQFFQDLKFWHRLLSSVKWVGDEKKIEEAKILLLNKLIFIQVLEDYALIPFKFLQTIYETKKRMWSPKGLDRFLREFFEEVNKWFYTFYDTEIFRTNILDYVEQSEENLKKLAEQIEIILGFGRWNPTMGRGLTFYNFRQIDEDVFGKAYEMFLAENRKAEGIYYTPKEITTYMARNLVRELFEEPISRLMKAISDRDYSTAGEIAREITRIAIVDPASGSGSFLVKVLREIYHRYLKIEEETRWAEQTSEIVEPEHIRREKEEIKSLRRMLGFEGETVDTKKLISLIILRHIYGIDLDERAVEIAKVNLWKEAIKLSPSAFRYDRLKDKGHILPDLEMNLVEGDSIMTPPDEEVVEEISRFRDDIARMWEIRNAYLNNPLDPSVLKKLAVYRTAPYTHLARKYAGMGSLFEKTIFFPLTFFFLYFDKEGRPLPPEKRGFHGVIGNPPWENIKPTSKEFAAMHPEIFGRVTKFNISGPEFKRIFNQKLKDPKVKQMWDRYRQRIKSMSDFIKSRYRLYGKGDLSYQKVFLERAMEISRHAVNILLPSNFHTDEGAMNLRREIIQNNCLLELISFENRANGWFKDVDSRFKFDIVFFRKGKCDKPFKAAFYITRKQYADWQEEHPERSFEDFLNEITFDYPVELISKVSPGVFGIVEFRRKQDVELIEKIRGNWKLLREWGWDMKTDFHMTNDNDLFNTEGRGLVLYEGKMIHQYDPLFSQPRYWVEEDAGRERLLSKELSRIKKFLKSEGEKRGLDGKSLRQFVEELYGEAQEKFESGEFKLDYETIRLVYRRIARSTDERTLISSFIPRKVFASESIPYFKPFHYEISNDSIQQRFIPYGDFIYLMALLNSFVLDYYIRQRVSANLNMFYVYELPIPDAPKELKDMVVDMAFSLLYRKGLFDDMAQEIEVSASEITDESTRREIRANLEVIIARDIFGLSKEDMEYILSTFIYGNPDRELMNWIIELY